MKEALKHLASGDASACEDSCLSLLKTKEGKNNANALVLLGKSQFLLNRPWRALKAYAKALEVDADGVQDKACKGIAEASTILYCEGVDSDGADRLEATKLVTEANDKLLSSFGPGDHYKWHDQHVAVGSFVGRVGAPAQDVHQKFPSSFKHMVRHLWGPCGFPVGSHHHIRTPARPAVHSLPSSDSGAVHVEPRYGFGLLCHARHRRCLCAYLL